MFQKHSAKITQKIGGNKRKDISFIISMFIVVLIFFVFGLTGKIFYV